MPYFFLKPVVWNTNKYISPSGARFFSGFPKENGFGHEEWNNSPYNLIKRGNLAFRTFHTEPLSNFPSKDHPGEIYIFMISSYNGDQYLVGVAGKATWIDSKIERMEIVEELALHDRWIDAWAVKSVKKAFVTEERLKTHWKKDVSWLPNWKCSPQSFLWLKDPLRLNPQDISGKSRLTMMYGRHQEITEKLALYILNNIKEK